MPAWDGCSIDSFFVLDIIEGLSLEKVSNLSKAQAFNGKQTYFKCSAECKSFGLAILKPKSVLTLNIASN